MGSGGYTTCWPDDSLYPVVSKSQQQPGSTSRWMDVLNASQAFILAPRICVQIWVLVDSRSTCGTVAIAVPLKIVGSNTLPVAPLSLHLSQARPNIFRA